MEALFAWPTASSAFSAIQPTSKDDARGSPPRKTARLDGDVDSSSKGKGKQSVQGAAHRGVRKLTVVYNKGSHRSIYIIFDSDSRVATALTPGLPPADDSSYTNTIRHALRALLDREESIPFLPSSYKAVFDAVEVAVALAGKGAEVYAMLSRELDRACAEGITRRLLSATRLPWLQNLVEEWKWFEGRVVSAS